MSLARSDTDDKLKLRDIVETHVQDRSIRAHMTTESTSKLFRRSCPDAYSRFTGVGHNWSADNGIDGSWKDLQ